MNVSAQQSADGTQLVISIQGRFDHQVHQDFRDSYEQAGDGCTAYIVDLRQTVYLDSSALGMLLLLRDHAGGDKASIRIVNCSPDVRNVLQVANFGQLFEID